MIKYEYRSAQSRHGKPKLKTIKEMKGLSGFKTIFGFNKKAQDYISSIGATKGVGKYPLYMDKLYLDFDNNLEAEKKSLAKLQKLGYAHEVYNTGGRGIHIHIPTYPVERLGIAFYIKNVVSNMFPGADEKIYKPTGIIRLPGTYHSKTNKQMVIVKKVEGKILNIDEHRPKGFIPVKPVNLENDSEFLDRMLTKDLNTCVHEGGRNDHAFYIAATACKLNLDKSLLEDLLMDWNFTKCNPSLSTTEIKTVINSAYTKG